MRTFRSVGIFVLLVLFLCPLTGCRSRNDWKVVTYYEIRDLGTADGVRRALKSELSANANEFGFIEGQNAPNAPYRFRLTNLRTIKNLKRAQNIIRRVTDEHHVPVDFSDAALRFQSIEGSAATSIIVSGTATPGAKVYLDTGAPRLMLINPVGPSGQWQVTLSPTSTLRDRGGWIYGLIDKDGTQLVIRTNVLDPKVFQTIHQSHLPRDSRLRNHLR